MTRSTSLFIVGLLIGIFCAAGVFSWIGTSQRGSLPAGARQLKIAHALPESHPVHLGLVELKRKAEELSGGQLRFTIFPGGQLGSEDQCLEKAQVGTLDITKVSAAPISNFVPAYKLFSLPYLFRDEAHYWKTLEGDVGRDMLANLATRGDGSPSGLHGLGYFDSGSRNFYSIQPLTGLADIRGKKFRVMNDPVAMDMVQAMGGSPTPIAFGELYTALKQGTVDGAENNPPSFLTSRHYEICKHYLLNHHSRIPDVILISSRIWDQLSAQEKQWLEEAIAHAGKFQRELWKVETEKALETLRKEGVSIIEPDTAPFRDASHKVYDSHANAELDALIQRIQSIE